MQNLCVCCGYPIPKDRQVCKACEEHGKKERDLVEVVRCKDCKYSYINSFSAQNGIALCKFWSNRAWDKNLIVQQDDFCSYGERKMRGNENNTEVAR